MAASNTERSNCFLNCIAEILKNACLRDDEACPALKDKELWILLNYDVKTYS